MKHVLLMGLLLFPMLGNGVAIAAPKAVINSTEAEATVESQLRDIEEHAFHLPVDAKVDRVWRAIPGLNGTALDFNASIQKTEQAHDGKLHPVIKETPPKVRLADLPPEPIYRGPSAEKSICLMINVSWGEEYVPSILRTLRNNHVHATFFLDGAWVRKHSDLVRQIAADGNAIGSHGSGHPDFQRLSNTQLEQQVQHTNEIIEKTMGKTPRLLAPPSGSYDNRTVKIARTHGMYTILWTADTIDWRRPPASVIVSRAVKGSEAGALILMHPTDPTAKALPKLIKTISEKGYRFKTVEQVVDEKRCPSGPH